MKSDRLLIIGVGSPAGDDRLGWEVVERLGARLPNRVDCDLLALDRPGTALIEYLGRSGECWLVDALWSPAVPGRYLQPSLEQLLQADSTMAGSHGFGLAETLNLAATLGALPHHLELHCLTIDSADTLSDRLTPAVNTGVDGLVQHLYQRLIDSTDHSVRN